MAHDGCDIRVRCSISKISLIEGTHLNNVFLVDFFFFRKNYLLLSVCRNIFFLRNSLSSKPIDLKIGLNVREGVVHVRKAWFFEILIASCKFLQNKFVCTVLTDLLIGFCWKLIYMYVLRWCWKGWFLKIAIGSCKFMQLAIFWRIHLCARLWLIY